MATENMETSESARAIDLSQGINKLENALTLSQKHSSQESPITAAEISNPTENEEQEEASDLSVTHALEALLGGLEPAKEPLSATDISFTNPDTAPSTTQKKDTMVISPINDITHESLNATNMANVSKEVKVALAQDKDSSTVISSANAQLPQLLNASTEDIEEVKPVIPGLGLWNNVSGTDSQTHKEPATHIAIGDVEMSNTKESSSVTATKIVPEAEEGALNLKRDAPMAEIQELAAETISEQISSVESSTAVSTSINESSLKTISRAVSKIQEEAVPPQSDVQMVDTEDSHRATVSEGVSEVQNTEVLVDSGNAEGDQPEWEIDSSPIQSSSDDSSSDDSSSDESEEGENAYKLLSPEEQARILMKGDGDSDDEGIGKANGSGGQLRTKNEVPDVVIPKPDVAITESMPIVELGAVDQIVDNILLIKAKTSGEYRVLESGSVLCLADRTVIGVVAETIGRVQQPFYSVLFTNPGELKAAGLLNGLPIYYSEQHSTFVFTQALKAFKGSDASNLHDEEVGDEEMEFSDDEAEAEHKRRVKQKKMERRGGKAQQNSNRGGHPLQQQHTPYDASKGLSYDDNDDGLYTPLARPASYASTVGRNEPPQEGSYTGNQNNNRDQGRDHFRGRGRGDRGRGRGDRGRGRGDRGRGRGGHQDRRSSSGFSLPPQTQPSPTFQHSPSPTSFSQPMFQPQNFPQPLPNPSTTMPAPSFYNAPPTQQYSPTQPQIPAWPQYQQSSYQPTPYQPQPSAQNNWSPPGLPAGAFINPAFFNQNNQPSNANPWNQQSSRGGRNNRGT